MKLAPPGEHLVQCSLTAEDISVQFCVPRLHSQRYELPRTVRYSSASDLVRLLGHLTGTCYQVIYSNKMILKLINGFLKRFFSLLHIRQTDFVMRHWSLML
jgi:hypothetical protein